MRANEQSELHIGEERKEETGSGLSNRTYVCDEGEGERGGSERAEQMFGLEHVRAEILRYVTKGQLEFGSGHTGGI